MLSIVIPTRNRQTYVVCAVRAALERSLDDIEVVVSDNSNEPEIIFQILNPYLDDSRLKILPSTDQVLTMKDNWERAIKETRGDWISIIGDDDLLDPSLQDFLKVIDVHSPETEVLTWEKPNYLWPDLRAPHNEVAALPLGEQCQNLVPIKMLEVLYSWNEVRNPGAGASIYHGVMRRSYIDRIKLKRGGKFFRYSSVDFDAGYTAFLEAKNVAISRRPFSIIGASRKSNAGSVNNYHLLRKRFSEWVSDGNKVDGSQYAEIPASLGIVPTVYGFQLEFAHDYRLPFKIDPLRIIKALEIDLSYDFDRKSFEDKKDNISKALKNGPWREYYAQFDPQFKNRFTGNPLRGVYRGRLYVPHDVDGAENIYDFYKKTFWLCLKADLVGSDFSIKIE
jgi:glycosyltransferase involved in cell wall biosynthesis